MHVAYCHHDPSPLSTHHAGNMVMKTSAPNNYRVLVLVGIQLENTHTHTHKKENMSIFLAA